jgi:hypothetical protein
MPEPRGPALLRFGPLGVVAVVWVAITVLFPTAEPQTAFAGSVPHGGGSDFEPGSGGDLVLSETDVDTNATPIPLETTGSPVSGGSDPGTSTSLPVTESPSRPGPPPGPLTTIPAGTSRGGMACAADVRQIPISTYAAPCIPAWSGDNGGATAPGVTADEIIMVERVYPSSANGQAVEAVGQQSGAATAEEADETFEEFKKYFNAKFELYGRTVKWIRYESQFGNSTDEAQSKGREAACLDADVVAKELGAFGVVGLRAGAVSGPFAECAAQRGVIVFNGAAYFPERFYRNLNPYAWAVTMECERISYQLAEYIGKRLNGKPAKWAGEPLLQAKTRAFATYVPNNDEYQYCVDITEAAGKRDYGTTTTSRYNYTLDVSRFPDEAARGIVQFKADGATTLVLACDPISLIFLTQSATSQAYYPEWLVIGVAAQDTDNYGQLYDQEQADGHMFGMSQLGAITKIFGPTGEPGRLYKLATGREIYAGTTGGYAGLHLIYNFIQAAGPRLTPDAIAAGARSLPPGGAPDYPLGYWSFADGPQGTPGAGDHTAIDDSREIYWTSKYVSEETGLPGTFVETYNGARFRNGQWPTETPPVFPEG